VPQRGEAIERPNGSQRVALPNAGANPAARPRWRPAARKCPANDAWRLLPEICMRPKISARADRRGTQARAWPDGKWPQSFCA
jgi:hypothetical protein